MSTKPLATIAQVPISRRGFVGASACAGAALACAGLADQAFAEGGDIGVDARPKHDQVHTICQGCPNECGYTAYTVEGKLEKIIGDAFNPNSAGNLCARGYGYTQSALSSANLKNPMRRKEDGSFQTITWDDAIIEIAAKLTEIVEVEGAETVALIYDEAIPDARAYASMFMAGLGSANVFVNDATYDVVKASAYKQCIGVEEYYADIPNANLVLLIDTSLTDVTTPNLVAALQEARNESKRIIAVDPRFATVASMADQWMPVTPGSELALLLAVCNWLITYNRYDESFVANNVADFDRWAKAIEAYTPAWAEPLTGLQAFEIEELASSLAEAAPRVAIQYGNGNIAGLNYANASETARVVCLLNALLGTYKQAGGALLPFDYSAISGKAEANLDGCAKAAYLIDASLAQSSQVGAASALDLCSRGQINALFLVNSNVAYDFANFGNIEEMLSAMPLSVCITQQMTETAEACQYILPTTPYLMTSTLPQLNQGAVATVSIAEPVLAPIDGHNAQSLPMILDNIAFACGAGVPMSDVTAVYADTALASFGLSQDALAPIGTSSIDKGYISRINTWKTPSGKIECADAQAAALGLNAYPVWIPIDAESSIVLVASSDMNKGRTNQVSVVTDDVPAEYILIFGQDSVIGNEGYNVSELTDIADMYEFDKLWINKDIAEAFGIEDGEDVIISNDNYACKIPAYVTSRIAPTAVFLPSSYGHTSKKKGSANGGVNPVLFTDVLVKNGYGFMCNQGVSVTLQGEGA